MNAINSPRWSIAMVKHPHPSPPDMNWLYSLPWRDRLELQACDEAPRAARRRLMGDLAEWSLRQFEVSATLVLSEIVTNSVLATSALFAAYAAAFGGRAEEAAAWTRPPGVTVWLRGGPSVIALLAWDASVAAPVPRDAGDDEESGRGLAIIDQLSAEWGYYYPAGIGGKVTWAVIDRP